ncbi:MAG: GNAT family N-acetyltransferase [Chitinophagaceae bacterium]
MLIPIVLEDESVMLRPLQHSDFESLYVVASDPLIWEQHPNPNRYQRAVFENYFKGAMESGGAYLIIDKTSNLVIGCSRFYDHDPENKTVMIGYTFFSRSVWGKGHNQATKHLMMNYAFQFVDEILFHVGEYNTRSRIAMTRLGAELLRMETVAYYGEPERVNCVFRIRKNDFYKTQ